MTSLLNRFKQIALVLFVLYGLLSILRCNPDPVTKKTETTYFEPAIKGTGTALPLLIIDTKGKTILDEPKIASKLTIILDSKILLQSFIGIELRGSTSQEFFDKKSFGFETQDSIGKGVDIEMLGFPPEEDFILYGPFIDKTLVRNVFAYELSNLMGQYASRTKFVEVQINATYLGIYVLMEKIKRDKNRVNINNLKPDENDGDDVTGGYIIKFDKTTGDGVGYTESISFRSNYSTAGGLLQKPPYGIRTNQENYYIYDEPKPEEITPSQKAYIQGFINTMESSISQAPTTGTQRDYLNYIDLESFVNCIIVNEVCGNVDAYRLSSYMSKDRNGKLKFGPVWDFNIAFGIEDRSRVDRWIYDYNSYVPGDYWLVHFWWKKLMSDPVVKSAVKAKWNTLRSSTLKYSEVEKRIKGSIDSLRVTGAIDRNFAKWDIISKPVPFSNINLGSYDGEVNYLLDWLNKRMIWMDSQIGQW